MGSPQTHRKFLVFPREGANDTTELPVVTNDSPSILETMDQKIVSPTPLRRDKSVRNILRSLSPGFKMSPRSNSPKKGDDPKNANDKTVIRPTSSNKTGVKGGSHDTEVPGTGHGSIKTSKSTPIVSQSTSASTSVASTPVVSPAGSGASTREASPEPSHFPKLKSFGRGHKKPADLDCAKPIYGMAKSIVTMLSAASMYIDADAEEPAEIPRRHRKKHSSDAFDLTDAVDMNKSLDEILAKHQQRDKDETIRANSEAQSAHDRSSETGTSTDSQKTAYDPSAPSDSDETVRLASKLPKLERTQTLFQVSMVSNLNRSTHEDSDDDEPTKSSRINELSSKLLERFELSPDEQFVANYQCMLLRDVLLSGHMYLTTNFLLFFAYLPKQKGEVVHSGGLALRTGFTPGNRISKQWCVLKETTFNVYNSATDLYFPNVVLDLRYVLRVELSHETEKERSSALDPFTQEVDGDGIDSEVYAEYAWFKIIMESRTYRMRASSGHAARQWINLLKKQVFTAKQNGDHVSVKIPLRSIIDVEGNNMFDGVGEDRTLLLDLPNVPMMIRARVTDEYAVDDWYFMSLSCGEEIYKTLKELVGIKTGEATPDDRTALSKTEPKADRSNLEITGSLLRKLTRRSSGKEEPRVRYTTGGTGNGSPLVVSPRSQTPEHSDSEVEYSDEDTLPEPVTRFHRRHRGWGPGSFIKQVVSSANLIGHATSMWAAGPAHYSNPNSVELGADDPYYVTSEHDRQVANDHFKHHFSLPDNARLVSSYYAHFQKTIPTYGKMYVGEKEICFRSLLPGVNFLMILPFADVETCYKEKGFRFGYSGLVIVIHGHEELFMEFATSSSRDDCELVLLKQMDALSHRRHRPKDTAGIERGKLERARLQMYEDKLTSSAGLDVPIIIEENPYFKTEVRPSRPYKFTLLTIGSRGDVQPYIALGKGLTAEGHRVTIATHKEFQEWIESHGLEFAEVAGNPAELMSLMVTHGTMSVSFLKEASTKFRGWISELLSTSWEACQGADVLIESPSAMAGLHIAEALNIPYLRAFTMPWTKTRAYPHAFIVPDQKRGGSYNYLTHVMFETVFWKGISGQVNPWRVDTLGLPRTNLEKMQQFKVPFSYNVSPTVFPPSVDFPDWVKVTGYWFLDESSTYTPPDALVQFIAAAGKAGKKLVYIGFGSIVVSDPKELTQAVVDAVVQADVYCILNKGWSDRLNKKDEIEVELPPSVYNAGAIPHDWLFPKVDAAVHHGGSGTTGASLRAGTPTIIKPFFGDQYFYGGRVQDLGAGVYLRKLNAKSLAKAIKDVTTKTRIIEKAKLVGEQIRAENGVSTAIETIYSELEYARKLITEKRKAYKNEQSEGQVDENSVAEDEGSWMMV